MYVKNEFGYKKRVRKKAKRPPYISILCLAVIAYGFWDIISSYIGVYQGFGTLYPAANALMIVFSFVAISGVWSMEKWGPISFPIVITLKLLVDVLWGHFNPWILLAFIPAGVFLYLLPKMKNTE
jgi:hypothetical protein